MTDAKCPWCGAVQRGKAACVDHGCGMATRFVCGSVTLETLHQRTESQSEECLRTELAQHKQRLMDQSARLAAAESELRRMRQVIEAADSAWILYDWSGAPVAIGDSPQKCSQGFPERAEFKLIPLSELEEKQ